LRTSYYRDGRPMEQGHYVMGRKAGEWRYWYPDSTLMLVERWEDTLVFVIDAWDRDRTHTLVKGDGVLRTYYASGSMQEAHTYANGVRNGPAREWWPAGNPKSVGEYRGGVKHGRWEYWTTGGRLEKREHYDKGVLHGTFVRFGN